MVAAIEISEGDARNIASRIPETRLAGALLETLDDALGEHSAVLRVVIVPDPPTP